STRHLFCCSLPRRGRTAQEQDVRTVSTGGTRSELPGTGAACVEASVGDEPPRCPRCGEDRLLERLGRRWVCLVCAFDWPADVSDGDPRLRLEREQTAAIADSPNSTPRTLGPLVSAFTCRRNRQVRGASQQHGCRR